MSQNAEINPQFGKIRKNLILSLAINALVPVIVYALARPLFANDAAALAAAGAVPAIRVLVLWIVRKRVDWIGAMALLGFVVACAVSIFLHGNPLMLEVHGTLLTGPLGVVLLISAAIGRPLLVPFMQAMGRSSMGPSNNPQGQKRITLATAIIGGVLLIDAALHIILALTLPTSTFLSISRLLNWAILGGGAAILWLIRQRVGRLQN